MIAYNNFEGHQTVNLARDVKEFGLNVTIQQKVISLSPLAYGIIGVMAMGSVDDFVVEDSEVIREAVIRRSREVYGSEVQVESKKDAPASKMIAEASSEVLKGQSKGML